MPAIIQFLGYDPFSEPRSLSERMRTKRRIMGWTIKEAARRLGVDSGTWGEWEATGVIVWKRYRELLDALLDA
jgi:transcriptional regulator with XRE-family HTH domain